MKNSLKKILTVCAVLCAAATSAFSLNIPKPLSGKSVFERENAGIFLENLTDAFDIYAGYWSGTQVVSLERLVPGTSKKETSEIMTANIDQRYFLLPSNAAPKLLGSGSINANGESIPTRSAIFKMPQYLLLEIYTPDNRTIKYTGVIDGNSVVWFPIYKFMNYDFQMDSFYRTEKGIMMISKGVRYISVPQHNIKGFVMVKTMLVQNDSSYPKDKANLYDGSGDIFKSKKSSFGN